MNGALITDEVNLKIASEADIVLARQQGRALAAKLGFNATEQALIATAISEVTRNIVQYAGQGTLKIEVESHEGVQAVVVIAQDNGPGIPDIARAMEDGYSTGGGLGLGLPGAKRLMNDFLICSETGKGTTVTMKKWKRS